MNQLLIGGAAAALIVAAAPATAQPAPPPGVAQGTAPGTLPPMAPGAPRAHMMVMSNKVMTRDEAVQHVRKLFARLDTNRDGSLTREEIDSAHQKMMSMHGGMEGMRGHAMGMPRPDRAAMFDRLDANHDGSISRQEFLAAQPQLQERRMMIYRNGPEGAPGAPAEPGMQMKMHGVGKGMGGHLLAMADANRDGRVTLQEAESAALQHFDRADLNHDGKITPEERQQAHQLRHRGQRPS
jgi:Ca2+-binding EF-hand superfamily protein